MGEKRDIIFTWINDNKCDVCLIQESYCTKDFSDKFKNNWDGEIVHSFTDSSHSRGVCILFRKNLDYKLLSTHNDNSGRLLLVNVEINGKEYTIVNIYSPNNVKERIIFLQMVNQMIRDFAINKTNLLIGGILIVLTQ